MLRGRLYNVLVGRPAGPQKTLMLRERNGTGPKQTNACGLGRRDSFLPTVPCVQHSTYTHSFMSTGANQTEMIYAPLRRIDALRASFKHTRYRSTLAPGQPTAPRYCSDGWQWGFCYGHGCSVLFCSVLFVSGQHSTAQLRIGGSRRAASPQVLYS